MINLERRTERLVTTIGLEWSEHLLIAARYRSIAIAGPHATSTTLGDDGQDGPEFADRGVMALTQNSLLLFPCAGRWPRRRQHHVSVPLHMITAADTNDYNALVLTLHNLQTISTTHRRADDPTRFVTVFKAVNQPRKRMNS